MKVKNIMSRKIFTVTPCTLLKKVVEILNTKRISGLPVVNKENKLVGIVSEKDILRAMYPSYAEFYEDSSNTRSSELFEKKSQDILNLKVSQIMQKNIKVINDSATVMEACSTLLAYQIRRLPVVNKKGSLIGIVSQGDVFGALMKYGLNSK